MQGKILTFLIFILLISSMNVITITSISLTPLKTDSSDHFGNKMDGQLEEEQILQNLNEMDGFFTKNNGQMDNESVRYSFHGKGIWFLDDAVVFEFIVPIKST